MTRVLNFAPGPSALPLAVLEKTQADLVEDGDSGLSVLEHTHRGPVYAAIHAEAKALLRSTLGIGDAYEILFMQGGARGQFAIIPMNLLSAGKSADFITTGTWSEKALAEAQRIATGREAANTKTDGTFVRVPTHDELTLDEDAAYVHMTSNNTIFGTQFSSFPKTKAPLIVDMSSDIAWRPMNMDQFGLVYAGAQKNLGIPGITLVIIRKDVLEASRTDGPEIFRYRNIAKADSLQNTIPTFAVTMMRNMLRWIGDLGGLEAMEARNRGKARRLYDALAASGGFYRCPVDEDSRSMMNVVFRLPSEDLEAQLVKRAAEHKIVGIKGHRSVGGLRVSLYNAIEPSAVDTLVELLQEFAAKNG
ncbi:MAG: 3-phosphoserine/phosphohydroxythreonine transaminase [Myxococcota bacterium]